MLRALVGVDLPEFEDLPDSLGIVATALEFREHVLDVIAYGVFLRIQTLNAFDERAKLTGGDARLVWRKCLYLSLPSSERYSTSIVSNPLKILFEIIRAEYFIVV